MTARQYAKECGVEIVGKLTKKVNVSKKFDYLKGEFAEERYVYYIDEAGTSITKGKGGWVISTADGEVY